MQRRGFSPPAIRHRGGTERLILLPLSHLRLDPTHLSISSKHANTDPAAHSINLNTLYHEPTSKTFPSKHQFSIESQSCVTCIKGSGHFNFSTDLHTCFRIDDQSRPHFIKVLFYFIALQFVSIHLEQEH